MRLMAVCKPAADLMGSLVMTLCPVALAVGCTKCPVFSICPARGVKSGRYPLFPAVC